MCLPFPGFYKCFITKEDTTDPLPNTKHHACTPGILLAARHLGLRERRGLFSTGQPPPDTPDPQIKCEKQKRDVEGFMRRRGGKVLFLLEGQTPCTWTRASKAATPNANVCLPLARPTIGRNRSREGTAGAPLSSSRGGPALPTPAPTKTRRERFGQTKQKTTRDTLGT